MGNSELKLDTFDSILRRMKYCHIISLAAVVALAVIISGCSKQEDPVTVGTPPSDTNAANLQGAVDTVKQQARDVATSVSQATQETVAGLKQDAANARAQAETLLADARSYLSQTNYQAALNTLKELSNLQLTPEQQKALEDMRRQVQTALANVGATNAAQKLEGFLRKK